MSETIQLNRDFGWKTLGTTGMRFRAPGLTSNVIWRTAADHAPLMASALLPGTAAPSAPDLVEQALQEAGLTDQGSVSIPSGGASVAGPPNQIVLDRPIALNQIEFAIYRD